MNLCEYWPHDGSTSAGIRASFWSVIRPYSLARLAVSRILSLGPTRPNQPLPRVSANWKLKERDQVIFFINQCEGSSTSPGSVFKGMTWCKHAIWGGKSKFHLDRNTVLSYYISLKGEVTGHIFYKRWGFIARDFRRPCSRPQTDTRSFCGRKSRLLPPNRLNDVVNFFIRVFTSLSGI